MGGGIMVFDYQKQCITLLHNRDNWDERSIEAADWDYTGILGGLCKSAQNFGVWIGVCKDGRFACLADSCLHDNDDNRVSVVYKASHGPCSLPVAYLEGKHTPESFAEWIETGMAFENFPRDDPDPRELTYTYELIVGDLSTSTVFHISKPVASERVIHTRRVPFGVHTLSLSGLDNITSLKDTRLRTLFEEHIGSYENGVASLEEFTQKVLGDRVETVPGDKMSSIFVEKKDYHGKKRYGFLKKRNVMEQAARRHLSSNEF
ncbi:hypothetical protein YC2023_101334 [Brassica napus]|uniref:(rape) hypothetical protein n=1 Tax=Brassica napus TaxID=3708 RepID=A0A816UK59_BRANA|nr:unnamed protein product [Brassica napus]